LRLNLCRGIVKQRRPPRPMFKQDQSQPPIGCPDLGRARLLRQCNPVAFFPHTAMKSGPGPRGPCKYLFNACQTENLPVSCLHPRRNVAALETITRMKRFGGADNG
jgi:hypothetical protein